MKKGLNIYKRKDSRYEGRYIKCYVNNKPKYGYVYALTYNEAKEKLINMKNNNTGNILQIKSGVTLREMADEWLATTKIKVKQSSYTKYYYTVINHINNKIGCISMSKLQSISITEYTNEIISEGKLSTKTIQNILIILNMILKYYKKRYDNNFNIEITYPRNDKKIIEILTDDEIMALEKYLTTDIDTEKLGVLLTLYTGLRLGELCALKWENINLTDGYISIAKTLQRVKCFEKIDGVKTKLIEESPKSQTSIRQIPLPDFILPLLKSSYKESEGLYILTDTAQYIDPRTYQNHFKKYLTASGVKATNFHVLRHTFATRCIKSGCDIKSVSEMLGHANIKITLELYVHPDFEQKKANINKVLPLAMPIAV